MCERSSVGALTNSRDLGLVPSQQIAAEMPYHPSRLRGRCNPPGAPVFHPARLLGGCNPPGTPALGALASLSSGIKGHAAYDVGTVLVKPRARVGWPAEEGYAGQDQQEHEGHNLKRVLK